jgi:glycosyltransferase involved in cell wall biosynthesis
MLEKITPLIITYNEAANIDRTLDRLTWAKEIIIIDSYSNDRTLEIIANYPQAKVIQNNFESFASQCNFGLSKIASEWVLSIDADYVLSQELIEEMALLSDAADVNGYAISFKYAVFGKPLRGTLYPPRKVLYKKDKGIYENDGHAHKVSIDGQIKSLEHCIYHDDRKSLNRWFNSQIKYADLEMQKLLDTPIAELSFVDKIRLTKVAAPLLVLIYCLFYKGVILDGWHGIYYALQRLLAELVLSIKLTEREFFDSKSSQNKVN